MKTIIEQIKQSVKKVKESFDGADTGYTQLENASGDVQLKQDVLSDMIITNELSKAGSVRALISEEKPQAMFVYENAKYIIAYDPLDGSSLFDVNHAVGSIFAVYEGSAEPAKLRAAVYSIYGPRTQLVICEDAEPKLYELQDAEWVFVKALRLSERGKTQAPGGTQNKWPAAHKAMVQKLFDDGYRLRYSGAMVADLHHILLKGGGLFSYPGEEGAANDGTAGKLRVLFEVYPFAYIFEHAGGFSSDGIKGSKGYESLLNLKFATLHASSPCYLGSKSERAYLDGSL